VVAELKIWNAIEKCLQKLNIQKETLVYPAPSAIIEHLQDYFIDEYEELQLLSELEAEDTRISRRRADPLDMNLTLATWCKNILNGKFTDEFQKITEGLDGQYLYSSSPQHIILKAKERGVDIVWNCAVLLYSLVAITYEMFSEGVDSFGTRGCGEHLSLHSL
jgi:hypothetical protein